MTATPVTATSCPGSSRQVWMETGPKVRGGWVVPQYFPRQARQGQARPNAGQLRAKKQVQGARSTSRTLRPPVCLVCALLLYRDPSRSWAAVVLHYAKYQQLDDENHAKSINPGIVLLCLTLVSVSNPNNISLYSNCPNT